MLKGINGLPYGDLSSFLDYEEFKLLEPEINAGIAKCKDAVAIEGAFFKYPAHEKSSYKKYHKSLLEALDEYNNDTSPKHTLIKLWEDEKGKKLQSTNKFIRYLKSKHGAYDPMYSIHLAESPWFIDCVAEDIIYWNHQAMQHFPKTIEWIHSKILGTIFKSITGMISIMFIEQDGIPNEHRDGGQNKDHVSLRIEDELPEQMIHLRNPARGFYLFDPDTKDKVFINTWACVFNTNDWHSTQRTTYPAWSLRIDGEYTDQVKEALGWPT